MARISDKMPLDETAYTGGMVTEKQNGNAIDLAREFDWFFNLLDTRFKLYFGKECNYTSIYQIKPPELNPEESMYASFLEHYQLTISERIMLVLCLAPHVKPQLLDAFFTKNSTYDRGFTEFGGIAGTQHSGFLPTGETLLFILAGDQLDDRFNLVHLLESDHFFYKHNIIRSEAKAPDEPTLSRTLQLDREFVDYFTTGRKRKPNFSIDFPAELIETPLEWEDLILNEGTNEQIEEILAWIDYGDILMNEWELKKKVKPGFRTLFYGPPGTGKTLTACLLGKATGRDVYRIDLSMVVSKFIGETEKNLAKVFDQAKDWILFFDEADSLFGKRTNISDSHDKYANQEVSYLLQRIEGYEGVVILATNMKDNLDEAFSRRFQSMINFPMPKAKERVLLWENGFSDKSSFEPSIDMTKIAKEYAIAGGAIMNVVRYVSLMALRRGSTEISLNDIKDGIRKEYQKEGKIL
jgi:hypothetical protein